MFAPFSCLSDEGDVSTLCVLINVFVVPLVLHSW